MDENDYFRLAREALAALSQLTALQDIHLTSVAKAIETVSNENVKIIFRGVPKGVDGREITGVTISQECEVRRPGVTGSQKLVEHFIYYSKRRNLEETRFFVAHELGHILLHHLYGNRDRERKPVPGNDAPGFYVIEFTDEEEAAADIFAAILVRQHPRPRRAPRFFLPCLRDLLRLKKRKLLSLGLAALLPKKVSCVDSGHAGNQCFGG
jgi:hypothetical protein